MILEKQHPLRPHAAQEHAAAARAALRNLAHCVHTVAVVADQQLLEVIADTNPDFVVPCVGPGSPDDGALLELLEMLNLPYAGAPAAVARACADKVVTKHVLHLAGLPVLPHQVVGRRGILQWQTGESLRRAAEALGREGVIMKPVHGGGALGVRLSRTADHLAQSVTSALCYDAEIMLEPFLTGRELSVVLVGPADAPVVFGVAEVIGPVTEVQPNPRVWDRAFLPATEVPLDVPRLAQHAYAALGCRDGATVDFILDDEGRAQILEVDTALDFAPAGLVACAAASSARATGDALLEILRRVTA
jgi:D-alanine-D-alanine ligase